MYSLNIYIAEIVFFFTGFRFAPVISTVDEEVESQHLRFLAVPPGRTVCDILNGVVSKSGLIRTLYLSVSFSG